MESLLDWSDIVERFSLIAVLLKNLIDNHMVEEFDCIMTATTQVKYGCFPSGFIQSTWPLFVDNNLAMPCKLFVCLSYHHSTSSKNSIAQ